MENFIGLNIKYLCLKNFLSQKDFGELFELGQSTIGGYISGRTEPNIKLLQKICKHFEIMIDDFINLDLASKSYQNSPIPAKVTGETQPGDYGDKDRVIAAQAETIDTLKKHNSTLEKLVENLEEKLSQAS